MSAAHSSAVNVSTTHVERDQIEAAGHIATGFAHAGANYMARAALLAGFEMGRAHAIGAARAALDDAHYKAFASMSDKIRTGVSFDLALPILTCVPSRGADGQMHVSMTCGSEGMRVTMKGPNFAAASIKATLSDAVASGRFHLPSPIVMVPAPTVVQLSQLPTRQTIKRDAEGNIQEVTSTTFSGSTATSTGGDQA